MNPNRRSQSTKELHHFNKITVYQKKKKKLPKTEIPKPHLDLVNPTT